MVVQISSIHRSEIIIDIQVSFRRNFVVMLMSDRLSTKSGGKMSLYNAEMDASNIEDLIQKIITKYPRGRIVGYLQHPKFFKPLLDTSFDPTASLGSHFLNILLIVVPTCRNYNEYETFQLPPLIAEMLGLASAQEVKPQPEEDENHFQRLFKVPIYIVVEITHPGTQQASSGSPREYHNDMCLCFSTGIS